MYRLIGAILLASVALTACGRGGESEGAVARHESASMAHSDAGEQHLHEQTPATPAGGHAGHAAAPEHAGHTSQAGHAGHSPQPEHAGHSRQAGHAGHATAPEHARHTSRAQHAGHRSQPEHADHTSQAEHAGHSPEADHAGHSPEAEHAGHSPEAEHAGHAGQPARAHPAPHAAHAQVAAAAQPQPQPQPEPRHQMWMRPLGGGWQLMAMGQVFPVITWGAPGEEGSPLHRSETYLTQPAAMVNLESPGSRFVLRVTPNFEGLTIPEGELTFGGWGEGFIDSRHPHTLLHEMMVSYNSWNPAGLSWSVSAGKGFAAYGTDDPMSRPGLKYPTNHHLSQILERWTLNGVLLWRGWSVEGSIFGGEEPSDPWDNFGNIHAFGDSWSARVARRFGEGFGPLASWEASASLAAVREGHHGTAETTMLQNAALRHAGRYRFGELYGLVEASRSSSEGDRYFSLLGETQLGAGRHQPYLRVEYATRPEFEREGPAGSDDFFRYDHDDHAIGATRWLITTLGYGFRGSDHPWSVRPFVELNHQRVAYERGPASVDPANLFGTRRFVSISAGMRIFVGGGPMRMGAYGVLDPMSAAHAVGAHGHAHGPVAEPLPSPDHQH